MDTMEGVSRISCTGKVVGQIIGAHKIIFYKSSGELSLLMQYIIFTFWPAQSCHFKKLKAYKTKLCF